MAQVEDPYQIWFKRKAITAFFPYAVWLERGGERRMIDAFLGIVRATAFGAFMWTAIGPLAPAVFNRASPRTVILASPHIPWDSGSCDENVVARWAAAASEIPDTEEIGQNIVDALLHIASVNSLQQHIPVDIWAWLKKRPSLPPVCLGRSIGTKGDIVRRVRELGDAEILKSYFPLVWSERDCICDESGLVEMQISIREDFNGIGLEHQRKALVERLDYVLGQLNQGPGHPKQPEPRIGEDDVQRAKGQYERLKDTALEMMVTRTPFRLINIFDHSLQWILTGSHSTFICALPLL